MTIQDQIKAVVELSGCYMGYDCLTSRDSIIAVIENQSEPMKLRIQWHLANIIATSKGITHDEVMAIDGALATASQLTEALLRATGKWKE